MGFTKENVYDRYDYVNHPAVSNMLGSLYNRTSVPDIMPSYNPLLDMSDFQGMDYTPPRPTSAAPSLGFSVGDPANIPSKNNWSSILKKVLGVGSLAAGGASLFGYGGSTTNFTPTMTAAKAQQMTAQAGARAKAGISTQASLAKSNVASQYVGRGLGSAGAAIGDIAGIGVKAGQAAGLVDTELNTQLAQMLMEIDRQEYMRQASQAQEKRDIYSTLGDLGLSLGTMLLL